MVNVVEETLLALFIALGGLAIVGAFGFALYRAWFAERERYAEWLVAVAEWEVRGDGQRFQSRPSRPETILYWPISDYRRREAERRARHIAAMEKAILAEKKEVGHRVN